MQIILNLDEKDALMLIQNVCESGMCIEAFILQSCCGTSGNVQTATRASRSVYFPSPSQNQVHGSTSTTEQRADEQKPTSLAGLFNFTLPDPKMLLTDTQSSDGHESMDEANEVVSEFDSEEEMKESMKFLDGEFF